MTTRVAIYARVPTVNHGLAGANVNRGKETGFTALFSAVLGGHVEAVRLRLDAGAEIVPVQGVELRGYCTHANSRRHDAILTMLDSHAKSRAINKRNQVPPRYQGSKNPLS
jgi:ankyrin repeat protein